MIVTIDNIPVYQAVLGGEDTGMFRISLVDAPAVQSNFLHFDSSRKLQLYRVENEEKRLVRGVVMRADFPIYRRDEQMGEYYIIYKADTIRQMAEQYLAEGRQNNVNVMHVPGSDVEGVEMVQYFIKDSAAGISPEGFSEIADGSLFAEFHVTNDKIWNDVKEGTYQGFSLEGVFDLVPERDEEEVRSIVDTLAGKFSKLFKITNMTKLQRMKAALARVFQEMATVTTDKGILEWDGDDDLKAGDRVYVLDEAGERTDAADGEYKTDDNKTIVVVDGAVSEIRDTEAEVASEPEEESVEESFGTINTDKGVLEWNGEEDLKAGDEVFVTDEEGTRTPAPDGDYVTEDGKTIRVAEGRVAEIADPAAEVADEESAEVDARHEEAMARIQKFEESYDEKYRKIADAVAAVREDEFYVQEAGDDFAVVTAWGEDYVDHNYRYSVSWNEDGSAAVSDPVEVKMIWVPLDFKSPFEEGANEEMDALKAENENLRSQVEELKAQPAAEPAHEVVKTSAKVSGFGSRGKDRVSYLMSLDSDD